MQERNLYTFAALAAVLTTLLLKYLLGSDVFTITADKALLSTSYEFQPATIQINKKTGKILDVFGGIRKDKKVGKSIHYGSSQLLLPGLVDTHVHINDPGRSEWETFDSATKAALAGGVTTLVDMPLNSIPPTTSVKGLDEKKSAALGNIHTDLAFWAGSVPGNTKELSKLLKHDGVKGFKSFMINSGVDEFKSVSPKDIEKSFKELSKSANKGHNVTMLFHAESNSKKIDKQIKKDLAGKDSRQYETYLLTHPVVYELDAIKTLIKLMKKYPLINVHIVHLSTAEALPLIRQARADGLRLTVETCYHYLYFNSEDIPDGSVKHKCAPPIRDSENNKLLWKAIKDGDIDLITSDHSPADALTKNLEEGDFLNGWGGIASLGLGLPALHKKISEDTCENNLSLGELVEFLSHKPATLAGLGDRKGLIQKGYDADFAIFEPNSTHVLQEQDLLYKNQISPYVGEEFKGRLSRTYLRGVKAYDRYQGGVLEPSKHRGIVV
ncbi:allantoinase [Wallemia mellicola]|nr:allantoinase [Wallemia mellicola]